MKAVSEVIDGVNVSLLSFNSFESASQFADDWLSRNAAKFESTENGITYGFESDFLGKPPAKSADDIRNHKKFLYKDEFTKRMLGFKKNQKELDTSQNIKDKKLSFNDLGLGVFCFPRAAVALRKHKRPDNTIKIVSDVRDVYAYFPYVGEKKAFRIYNISGARASITAEQLFYMGFVALLVTQKLIESGFDVEVHSIGYSGADNYSNPTYCCAADMLIKGFDDELNIDKFMLANCDPRYMRYNGFKLFSSVTDYFKKSIPRSMGYPDPAIKAIRKYLDYKKDDLAHSIVIQPSYNESDAISEYKRIVGIINDSQNS